MFDRRHPIRVLKTDGSNFILSPDQNWNYDSAGLTWESDNSRFFMPHTRIDRLIQTKDKKPDMRNFELKE